MGAVPSTPRWSGGARTREAAEYLIATFVGEKSFPVSSDFWQKLLELPLNLQWPPNRVRDASDTFARNNYKTRHLAKVLVHLAWCLEECVSTPGSRPDAYGKALNALYVSSIFLKYLIENAKTDRIEELHLSLDESEPVPADVTQGLTIEEFLMRAVVSFIGSIDVSPETYLLHLELLNFMMIATSTQLLSGPSPGLTDVNPFIDAAMAQESSLVISVVRRLLLNYITRHPLNAEPYSLFTEGRQAGVLQKVGSAAANIVLLPLNYLVSSSGDDTRRPLADCSLYLLLVLVHYRKRILGNEFITDQSDDTATSDSKMKHNMSFSDNPFCKALENATDVEFDRSDTEGTAQNGSVLRLPFAALFDTLGMSLADEAAILLLYSLLQGNSDFMEYVLVRTDMDTLLMPILEALYNAPKRLPNQIYMLLIVLLMLSQDSSFNASLHKLILPSVSWYKERFLQQTSLGSLMVVILIRTVQYNLSKLRDVYLHTTCLATLANMAPHFHRLSSYASQRLVSLFDMLSRKYNKLSELRDNNVHLAKANSLEENGFADDTSTEMQIYTDFLRLVLEILNAILTYSLPRNPEVVYAIMQRQEVFQPFKTHPRFNELLENIYTVLDFFNSRMDAQTLDGEWSVEKVLDVIIVNCRSWRGEGMKMFTQLRFTYEQESNPEEFFIPYVWRLVLSRGALSFNSGAINLFPADPPPEKQSGTIPSGLGNGEMERAVFLDA